MWSTSPSAVLAKTSVATNKGADDSAPVVLVFFKENGFIYTRGSMKYHC